MGSPWRDKISLVILELQEKGEIQMLYDKWWKNSGNTCSRTEKGKENKANSLGVDNIGGVFVVLLCGLAVAMLVAIFEFCYHSRRYGSQADRRSRRQPSLCAQMADELCLAVRCDADIRPRSELGPGPAPAQRSAAQTPSGGLDAYLDAAMDLPAILPPPPPPATCVRHCHHRQTPQFFPHLHHHHYLPHSLDFEPT